MWYILRPEPEVEVIKRPLKYLVKDFLAEEKIVEGNLKEKLQFFKDAMKVTPTEIEEVAAATTGQATNELWTLVRQGRLTASNFGLVLKAKKITESLIKTLHGEYNLERVKAIQWGIQNEETAIRDFERKYNVKVTKCGIYLHESGVLGASPDGILGDDDIVEVKCPYSLRYKSCADGIPHKKIGFIIKADENGVLSMDTNHRWYHQIQGQLHVMKKRNCFLVIWTTKDMLVVKISYNPSWTGNIENLLRFYYEKYLCTLV